MLDFYHLLKAAGRHALLLAAIVGVIPATCAAQQSFLGVGVQEVDAALAKQFDLADARGVAVTNVVADSAAAKAGIEEGDVVLEYNGQEVVGVEQFRRLVRETPVGREVTLQISRDGQTREVGVTMGSTTAQAGNIIGSMVLPAPESYGDRFEALRGLRLPDTPRVFTTWRNPTLGIEAESLNDQLADYFGVDEGVLVRSVAAGSAAEKAGLRAGDVILEIGGDKVTAPRDVTNALRDQESDEVAVTIMRDHQQQELTVTVDQPTSRESFRSITPSRMLAPGQRRDSLISF